MSSSISVKRHGSLSRILYRRSEISVFCDRSVLVSIRNLPSAGEAYISVSKQSEPGVVSLGDAYFDLGTSRLLTKDGDEIVLRLQSARVLQMLAENCGQLVARDDLVDHVWPNAFVTDDSLTQCIADIRKALGDTNRALVKTLPKRGYLLDGQMSAGAGQQVTEKGDDVLAARLDPRDVLPTIAVFPVQSVTGTGGDALRMFIADEVVSSLGRSKDLNVISRMSTVQFANAEQDKHLLGRDLNADFVVSGHVQTISDKAHIFIEFFDTQSKLVLWSDRFQLSVEQVLENGDWAEHVVSHIRNAIMANEVARVRTLPLENLKLYSVLHGAVGLMHRLSPKEFNEAKALLDYLVEQAPHNPAPLAWLARWHVLKAVQGWAVDIQKEARLAVDCARRSLDIDPDNSLALASLGFVMTNLVHDFDEAYFYYDAALSINPNDATARALRGMLQAFCDKADVGLRDNERALHLTPRDPIRFLYLNLASGTNLSAGNFERAVALAKESLRLNRTHVSTLRTLAAAQEGAGHHQEAQHTVRDLMHLQPGLRVSTWLANSPSRSFDNGKRFADLLKNAGVPG